MKINDHLALKELTSNLTVLYVEDEEIFRITIEKKIGGYFKSFVLAADGIEGLEIFNSNDFDLLITDNLMPKMNGLDMIQEIRKKDTKTPIILVTGYIDTEFLIRSINLGVTQFVAKPINYESLLKAIEIATQRVILENLQRKTQEQELELFKYREKYHSLQQERAFNKELNIIKNDLFMKKIPINADISQWSEWHCSLVFKPMDIMSGDSYSIREIGECRFLFLLVDAMGKGLSASVTTILSTSYLNHLVNESLRKGGFSLQECINSYNRFIQTELLDDEIVCLVFILIDFNQMIMDYAMFSAPPFLIMYKNNEIVRVKSNNLPVMKFNVPFRIDRLDIKDAQKMLFYSDGLNECFSNKNELYDDYLIEDFRATHSAKELFNRFSALMNKTSDDITIIFLNLMSMIPTAEKSMVIKSRMKEVSKAIEEISGFVSPYISDDSAAVIMSACSEILLNAYEHGNIDLDSTEKRRLIAEDMYEDYLLSHEESNQKKINIRAFVFDNEGYITVAVIIKDEGPGFDVALLQNSGKDLSHFSGRGVRIAQSVLDGIYYNSEGNEVTLIKKFQKGGI